MSTIASSNEMPRSGRRNPVRRAWHSIRGQWNRQWTVLSPSRETRRGALWGILAAVASFVVVDIVYQPSGFGIAFDVVFSTASTVLVGSLIVLVVALLLIVVRHLPLVGTAVLVASCAVMTAGSFPQFTMTWAGVALSTCVAAGILGATISTVRSGRLAEWSLFRKGVTYFLLLTAAGYIVGFAAILADDGDLEKRSSWQPHAELMPPRRCPPVIRQPEDPTRSGRWSMEQVRTSEGRSTVRPWRFEHAPWMHPASSETSPAGNDGFGDSIGVSTLTNCP